MNFLAHFHLAHLTRTSRLGNFLGDFTKGSLPDTLPPPIATGIRLHRRIDGFTDCHPSFKAATSLLSPPRKRFAGIIVDVAFDHFLALEWHSYCRQPLGEFAQKTYEELARQRDWMPPRAEQVFERMRHYNWLVCYQDPATIHRALDAIAGRLSRPTALYGAGEEFEYHYPALQRLFRQFYPQLIAFSHSALAQLQQRQDQKGHP